LKGSNLVVFSILQEINDALLQNSSKTIFDMAKLDNMNNKGVGSIIFEKQKIDIDAELIVKRYCSKTV